MACYKVIFTPKDGNQETNYFSKATYLHTRIELTVSSVMGEVPLVIIPSDYKETDGILLPHKVRQKIGGVQELLVTVETVRHLPADPFALPEPVKALVDKPAKKE